MAYVDWSYQRAGNRQLQLRCWLPLPVHGFADPRRLPRYDGDEN